MTTRLETIIGGYGIFVSRMAGMHVIELDTSVLPTLGSEGPVGIVDDNNLRDMTYVTTHANEPDTQTWNINDDNNSGMRMTVQTATVYDASGDHVLYSMVRDLTFNSLGQLASVSAERRITVDATESCS